MSKNAIAMIVMHNDFNFAKWMRNSYTYLNMSIVCCRNLRKFGYDNDIVVITNKKEYKDVLYKEGIKFELRDLFDYQALHQYECKAWSLSLFDMQKIHYWSLINYDKILALDVDILATSDKFVSWDIEGVGALGNYDLGVNSGMMLLSPCRNRYKDMLTTAKMATFDPINGWNNCGPIKTECCDIKDWGFQASNAMQGFVPYYFKEELFNLYKYVKNSFIHFDGKKKYTDSRYLDECKIHGFVADPINHTIYHKEVTC